MRFARGPGSQNSRHVHRAKRRIVQCDHRRWESAKNLNRPGLQRLLTSVNGGKVNAVIIAKLDRLTRSVKDLCSLLELFEKLGVALIPVAESLDTALAAGCPVITIMAAVSQWGAASHRGTEP